MYAQVQTLIYKNTGCNIRGLVLNRKSFRDHSPIGLEKWNLGILYSDVKNRCACFRFVFLWSLVVYIMQIVGSKFKN